MASKKIITVFGATGLQGGAVVQTFLNDPKLKSAWAVRAITRDVTKDSAKKLHEQGAEVVAADLDDKSSLIKALKGAHTVFAVTNYWEYLDKAREVQQGKNIVDAAKEVGIQHLVWSGAVNVNKLSKGALPNVYHFDSKAEVGEYALAQGVPTTLFLAGMYDSNLTTGSFAFRQDEKNNNAWTFSMPGPAAEALYPLFETADTGKYVKAAVLHRDKLLGKRLLGATDYLTGREIVEAFKKVFPEAGKTATVVDVPQDTYLAVLKGAGYPDFVATELLENMRLMSEFGYYGGESLAETHALVEDHLTTIEEHFRAAPAFKDLK